MLHENGRQRTRLPEQLTDNAGRDARRDALRGDRRLPLGPRRSRSPGGARLLDCGDQQVNRLLGVRTVDDRIAQPERWRTGDAAADVLLQNGVVDGREVAENVGAQHMSMVVAQLLVGGDGAMGTPALQAGIRAGDESALEQWPDDGAQSVMYHTVAKRRSGDQARLALAHHELGVAARLPGPLQQLALQAQHLGFEAGEELRDPRLVPFAPGGA